MPKTFLAVNLSDAFSFEDIERSALEDDTLDTKTTPPKDLLTGAAMPDEQEDAGDAIEQATEQATEQTSEGKESGPE